MKAKYAIRICLITLLLLLKQVVFAQDVLYLNNGEKKQVIVTEITPDEVKYKNFSNPDGPIYSILKKEVALVVYKDGTSTNLSNLPAQSDNSKEAKPSESVVLHYPANLIAVNVWDFVFTSIGGSYEHFFPKGYFSLRVPFIYNFNPHTFSVDVIDGVNSFSSGSSLSPFNYYSLYMVGFEINYYPFGQGEKKYFAGIGANYGEFKYDLKQITTSNYPFYVTTVSNSEQLMGNHISFYVNNGFMLQLTQNFTLSLIGGLGFTQENTRVVSYTSPTFVFSANIGFRF